MLGNWSTVGNPRLSDRSRTFIGGTAQCGARHTIERSSYFADVSLSDWLVRTPPALVAQHFNVDVATIAKFPNDKPEIMRR